MAGEEGLEALVAEELQAAGEVVDMFFKKKIKENLLKCPRCNIKMEKLKKGNVIIDKCKRCKGMWLDAGEIEKLARMASAIKKGGKK